MKILTKCPSYEDLAAYFELMETGIDYHELEGYMASIDFHLVEMDCPDCNESITKLEKKAK